MTKKQYAHTSTLLPAFVVCVLGAGGANSQDRPGADAAKERIAAFYAALNDRMAPPETGRVAAQHCQDFFTVDYVESGTDPHLQEGYRFLIVGPHPITGSFSVTAVGTPHEWKGAPNHYQALPHPSQPDWFELWNVAVAPHNGEPERIHFYQMEITDYGSDGCPDYVFFHSIAHIPGPAILNPGHGGAGR